MAQRTFSTGDTAHVDGLTASVLRVHPEPCEYVDELTVHHALTSDPHEYVMFLEKHLRDIASGRSWIERPAKVIFDDGPGLGDFRVMPCVLHTRRGVLKTVKIVGTNLTEDDVPDQVTVGKAFSLHPRDNYIRRIYEACLLSSARTGACVAIAMGQLARQRSRISIVGAGRVSYYVALYACAMGGVEEINFHDLDPERARRMALWGNTELSVRCRAVEGPVQPSDIVVLATTSTRPIFAPGDLKTDLVISVGGDTDEQRELHSSWAYAADVYVDVEDSAKVGDIRAWAQEGVVDPAALPDLLTLLRDGPIEGGYWRRVFISTGSALFDNLTIAYMEGMS